MCDQLSTDTLLFNVPDGASRVYRAGTYHVWILGVPVKRCDGVAKVGINVLQNFMLFVLIRVLLKLPDSQILSRSGQNVLLLAFNIRNPHYLGGWKLMLKLIDL